MTDRQKLKELGLNYHKIAEFFGYPSASFANSTRRKLIEQGVLQVIHYVQSKAKNTNTMTAEQIAKKYVYRMHDALTDSQEIKEMAADIESYAEAFAQFLYNKEYLVRRSIDEAIDEFEKSL